MRPGYAFIATLIAALGWVGGAGSLPEDRGLPPGFSDRLVAQVEGPTAMTFTPDGRLLVLTQLGLVRVIDRRGHLLKKPALDLRRRTCTERERGGSGITTDPHFQQTHYVYIYYTSRSSDVVPSSARRRL